MTDRVKREIIMYAFQKQKDEVVIYDIVETSNKNASYFARRWLRNLEIIAIGTENPDFPSLGMNYREIPR